MQQYHDLLSHILTKGVVKTDRTGTGTRSVFGCDMRFDLSEGFPLITTKRLHLRSIIHELLWFLKGETNIAYLKENNVTIWDEWADENGDLGPVYGKQWRSWMGLDGKVHDQISEAIRLLKTSPDSRRIIVSAWNVADLSEMALMPCHVLFQFNTEPLTYEQRFDIARKRHPGRLHLEDTSQSQDNELKDGYLAGLTIPKYKLSCLLYQRKQHCALVA